MRLKIIINPQSKRKVDHKIFNEKLNGIPYSITTTTRSGEAIEVAKEAVGENVSKIVAVGGDGTVNEVINGIKGGQVSLGIIPTGGANDFASYLDIPKDINQALEIILNGVIRRIDLIKVNHRYFATVGGIGFGTEVALKVNAAKDKTRWGKLLYQFLGNKIYQSYALSQILFHPELRSRVTLLGDPFEHQVELWSLFISNQPYLGKSFLVHPGAVNDDGWLDVCVIKGMNSKFKQLITLLMSLKGKHLHLRHVETFKTKRLVIDCEKSLRFFGDGELLSDDPPYHVEVFPQALKVLVPRVN